MRTLPLAGLIATVLAIPAWAQNPNRLPTPVDAYPERHIEAPGQGAQDPARSEVLEGHSADKRKCLATLIARRETEAEAQEVCGKILHDLGE